MPNVRNAKDSQAASPAWEVVNRVVYPVRDQDLTMPLYVVEWTRPHLTDAALDPLAHLRGTKLDGQHPAQFQHLVNDGIRQHQQTVSRDVFTVAGRRALTVKPGKRASLCTFFNAFPASYWRRWTAVRTVRFTATVTGTGFVTLHKSNARGFITPLADLPVATADGESTTIVYDLPLKGMLDGGYFWFDVTSADDSPLTVADAAWSVPQSARRGGSSTTPTTLSIAITTFNRPSYCHDQLKAIAGEPALRERLDTVYCTDQGTDLVRDQPGFAETAQDLGPQLTYLRQRNLGGSGGFSRGMFETVRAGSSTYALMLDDDAISEPESIVRALNFADYTKKPTLVGGGMFHLDNRTILLTLGEHWNPVTNMHGPVIGRPYNHDFAQEPLAESPNWHQRIETDYNAWWMCLIPTDVIRTIGLGLPVFIKHDDVEFGLRARKNGFRTVSLPGVAVWHQAWHDKDPLRTWEEYFVVRNRWIQGLLHCDKPNWHFLREMIAGDVNAGCKLTYSAIALRHKAMVDLLAGPQHIVDTFPTIIGDVRKAREGFPDSTVIKDIDSVPEPERLFIPPERHLNKRGISKLLLRTYLHALFSRRAGMTSPRPQVMVPYKDAFWTTFLNVDSALVTTPDGDAVEWFRRDSALYRRMAFGNLRLFLKLYRNWGRYARMYRSYDMASMKVWERIFKETSEPDA